MNFGGPIFSSGFPPMVNLLRFKQLHGQNIVTKARCVVAPANFSYIVPVNRRLNFKCDLR